jgi:uncharacterized RDD family membrane protein YckC
MDPRLDFSDLIEFSDVPETIPANAFADASFAPVTLHADDGALPDAPPAPAVAGVVPELSTRILAKLIDGAVAAVLYGLVSAFFTSWFTAFFLGGLAASAYLLLSDGLEVDAMHLRSFGKRVMGLTVERIGGERMDVLTSIRRNWMFTVGFFAQAFTFMASPVSYLLTLVALGLVGYELYWLVTNPSGVRWGDDLARTDVLKPVPVAPAAVRTEVLHLTPEEAM